MYHHFPDIKVKSESFFDFFAGKSCEFCILNKKSTVSQYFYLKIRKNRVCYCSGSVAARCCLRG